MSDIEGALAAAREAESWSMTVESGEDVSWLDDDTFRHRLAGRFRRLRR